MRRAITPADLLNQWYLKRLLLVKKLQTATGTDREVMEVMDFMLYECIKDLDAVLNKDYPESDLLRMMVNRGDA